MRTLLRSTLILSLLAAAPVAAQTPAQETPEPPPNVAEPPAGDVNESTGESDPISLSGCLQRDPEGSDGFVLTRTAGDSAEPGTEGREGAAPQAPERPAEQGTAVEQPASPGQSSTTEQPALSTYRLVAGESAVELGAHVGHHVQVEGQLQAAPGELTPSSPRSGDANAGAPGQVLTTLEVTSLRMIGASCEDVEY